MKLPSNKRCLSLLLNKVQIQITLPKMVVYPQRVNYSSSGTTDLYDPKKFVYFQIFSKIFWTVCNVTRHIHKSYLLLFVLRQLFSNELHNTKVYDFLELRYSSAFYYILSHLSFHGRLENLHDFYFYFWFESIHFWKIVVTKFQQNIIQKFISFNFFQITFYGISIFL